MVGAVAIEETTEASETTGVETTGAEMADREVDSEEDGMDLHRAGMDPLMVDTTTEDGEDHQVQIRKKSLTSTLF